MSRSLCSRGISSEMLSAYYSRQLPAGETTMLDNHIPTCRACVNVLDTFDRIADDLRSQHVPPSGPELWRDVYSSMRKERGSMPATQKTRVLTGLVTALVIIIFFTLVFIAFPTKAPEGSMTLQPTSTTNRITPQSTSTAYNPTPQYGWKAVAALPYGKWVAFSKTAPQTGYACGNTSPGTANAPILLGVTQDGGQTWSSPVATPVSGMSCTIYVDPFHAQDIVLDATACSQSCGPSVIVNSETVLTDSFFRSLDGGATWGALHAPSGDLTYPDNGPADFTGTSIPQWTPTSMFMQVTEPHFIAASIQEGPMQWTAADASTPDISNTNIMDEPKYTFASGDTFGIVVPLEQVSRFCLCCDE